MVINFLSEFSADEVNPWLLLRSKSAFSYLRTLTTWHCPHLPAAAAAVERYLLSAWPTTAELQQRVCCCAARFAAVGPCWDRQTDGHGTVSIDPAPRTVRAVCE